MSLGSIPFEMQQQPSNADFDIITLNIDDDFQIDPQDDDILFKKDHQFDLASYIGGESTSLLLSPINDASNIRQRLKSLNGLRQFESNVNNDVSQGASNLIHDKVTKTPASNRRKRKNLSREFIDSSDSDEDNKTNANNSIKQSIDDSKRTKAGKLHDDDPVWCPPSEKRNTKTLKQQVNRTNELNVRKELKDIKNASKCQPTGQGKGLRNMLKQQMFSDRPINKSKLLKTMSSSIGSLENPSPAKMAYTPVKSLGIGRGKDIAITAKYYNCTESSDNSERDKPNKPYNHNRYHQIYTESEDSVSDSDSNSYIDVSSEPSPLPKVISKGKVEISIVETNPCNENKETGECKETKKIKVCKKSIEKPLESSIEKKLNSSKPIQKSMRSKPQSNNSSNKPIIIDSSSLDSTDFAKALVTKPKAIPKVKSSTSKVAKKNHLEQQKRLIQSNLLLQNPSKFKIFANDKSKSPTNSQPSNIETKATVDCKLDASNIVKELPKKIEKQMLNETPVEIETKKAIADQVVQEIKEDVKPDVVCIEANKVEANSKRKLNLQEYLKRKNLKSGPNSNNLPPADDLVKNIKVEKSETNGATNSINGTTENICEVSGNLLAGNSMYEEIIIVSMGCNTDISIPEASFIQPSDVKDTKSTVLLSDIQTSVEKATSKISCCSLISSIQDVILKKSHCIEQKTQKETKENGANVSTDTSDGNVNADEKEEHGENKVIMHLRKDRVRPMRNSISIQTDPYFQFPPLEKLVPLSKKSMTLCEKRTNSVPRDNRSNEIYVSHSDNKSRHHRNYRNHLSESSYYSDEDEKRLQRPSRHSEFINEKSRHKRVRRESSRYSSSKYDRYLSRQRTISRSLSSSSDTSTTSTDSSSSSQSSGSSKTYNSSASARSLNSYGGSSSKSYGDDHKYYRIRTTSNNSRRSNYRQSASKRNNSPGGFYKFHISGQKYL